ncbi:MAG: hypothetical protein LBB23_00735 [Rickettsiales bacterium]|jgi:hypothetical protein|nr:hypothetical protein [Rickettsiales bacterium]
MRKLLIICGIMALAVGSVRADDWVNPTEEGMCEITDSAVQTYRGLEDNFDKMDFYSELIVRCGCPTGGGKVQIFSKKVVCD